MLTDERWLGLLIVVGLLWLGRRLWARGVAWVVPATSIVRSYSCR